MTLSLAILAAHATFISSLPASLCGACAVVVPPLIPSIADGPSTVLNLPFTLRTAMLLARTMPLL